MHRGCRQQAALLAAVATACLAATAGARPQPPPIQAFSLADVELASASEFGANFEQNAEYLLALSPDNLLYNFRTTAGLDAPGESYGGWEWSDSEVRGQFIGHYLSAIAFAALHTGQQDMRDRCDLMVGEVKKVQDSYGNGYLAAFPQEHFDRLEALQPVWVPYYVVHKLLQGLIDQHSLAGQEQALGMAEGMASYFCGRVARVLAVNGTDHWQKILETEFGGMNDALYNLYAITQNDSHAECAHWFDKPAFMRPLVEGGDPLPGLHANTHMAQVQGFAARYEQVGDPEALAATAQFFGLLLQHHSFSTGGSNWYEHWAAEDSLGEALNSTDASFLTEESCTQYNLLKLARWLFRHTGDAALADFYERAMLNGVIGVQKLRRSGHHHSHGHSHSHSHSHPHLHLPGLGHSHSHGHGHSHTGSADAAPSQHPATPHSSDHQGDGQKLSKSGSSGTPSHTSVTRRNDSHPHNEYAPCHTTHIHLHNSHFHNSTATIHVHVHGGPGDSQPQTTTAGEGAEGALGALDAEGAMVLHAEQRRRLAQAAAAAAAAADASSGQGLARPDNYKVMSWPGEPWADARAAAAFAAGNNGYPPEAGPGVFIYFQPLGAGGWKGDKSHSWSHGWGDAFNTFWCCYGTAVESFSKLADSIYFKHMPDVGPSAAAAADTATTTGAATAPSNRPSTASTSTTGASTDGGAAAGPAAAAAAAASGSAQPGDGPLPELWVNQLVSSSVRWHELRMVARQEAELYGPNNTATSRLTIDIYPPDAAFPAGPAWVTHRSGHGSANHSTHSSGRSSSDSGSAGAQGGVDGEESRLFALNWRIPGWAKASEVQLRVNGRNVTHCTEEASAATNGGKAPPFGEGARFCTLGYSWSNGDQVEAVLPMRVRAEALNDARKPLRRLKAIMLGPLLLAGLTNGTNDVAVDPHKLEEALSLPDSDGFVSLAAAGTAGTAGSGPAAGSPAAPPLPPPLLRLCGGSPQLGRGCAGGGGGASPLEATFRLVAPLAGCKPEAGTSGGSEAEQAADGEDAPSTGNCSPARTRQLLMQPQPDDSLGGAGADAWGRIEHQFASFESAAWPGHFLTADAASGALLLQQASAAPAGPRSQTFLLRPAQHSVTTAGAAGDQPAFTLEPLSLLGSAVVAGADGSLHLQVADEVSPAGTPFLLTPPAASAYPPGARLLRGGTRDYLLVPIGQVQDELYTAYFHFLPPSQH